MPQGERSASLTSPFTEAHAIVFADFGISVRTQFTRSQYDAIREAVEPLLTEEGFQLQPSRDEDDTLPTLVYERVIADSDEVAEAFHLHDSHVHLMIHEYRGWQVTRAIAMRRFAPILDLFGKKSFAINEARLVLGYRDAFINPQPHCYSALDVFKQNTYLPSAVFEAGKFWQQELTVVEDAKPEDSWDRIIARTTVDARVLNLADVGVKKKSVHWTEITHRQQLAVKKNGKINIEWSTDLVATRLDALHARNKNIMIELLSHEMADRIGLLDSTP